MAQNIDDALKRKGIGCKNNMKSLLNYIYSKNISVNLNL